MISTILGAFRVREIRKKILFTALLLGLYRLGTHILAPGISASAVKQIQSNLGGNGILGLLNLFSGGALTRIAIFALGIMPYITASIILQLLTVVVPSLEKLQKEGEVGQARITQYTRYLTVGLAFAQSIGYVFLFKSLESQSGVTLIPNFNVGKVLLIAISLTAGTVLVMWMGELDHPAGDRQRYFVDDLRQHRGPDPERAPVLVDTRTRRSRSRCRSSRSRSLLPSCSSRRASAGFRSSTPNALSGSESSGGGQTYSRCA